MLTPVGVVLIGLVFLVACLLAIYLYAIRINSRITGTVNLSSILSGKESSDEDNSDVLVNDSCSDGAKKKKNKKNRKGRNNSTDVNHYLINTSTETSKPTLYSSSSLQLNENNDEDDILALASLRGYDISQIRSRKPISLPLDISNNSSADATKVEQKYAPSNFEIVNSETSSSLSSEKSKSLYSSSPEEVSFATEIDLKSGKDFEFSASVISTEIVETEIITAEPLVYPIKYVQTSNLSYTHSTPTSSLSVNDWSQVPTKEEEAAKVMKNKLIALQAELEETEHKVLQSSRNVEQSQRRVAFLEQELKEQRKMAIASKSANDAQLVSLRAINNDMAAKLANIEAGYLDASVSKKEAERFKELANRLQSEIIIIQEEKKDLSRQMSELTNEIVLLNEKANLSDYLTVKCEKLEEELGESRRALSIEIEAAQSNLKTTLSNLENEIASHRAEHANSVGSSTALHQEIVQLKIDIRKMAEKDSIDIARIEELEKLNMALITAANKTEYDAANNFATQEELKLLKLALAEKDLEIEKIMSLMQNSKNELEVKTIELESVKLDLYSALSNKETSVQFDINQNLEIEALKAEINLLKSDIESFKSSTDSKSEIEFLRTQLAESEIKISGLKSEVAREIKRANISKIVYENKLAELNKI